MNGVLRNQLVIGSLNLVDASARKSGIRFSAEQLLVQIRPNQKFSFLEMFSYAIFEAPQILELERDKEKEATNHHVGKRVLN